MKPDDLEAIDYGTDAGIPERKLWSSVLALLIQDAMAEWKGIQSRTGAPHDLLEAFEALTDCNDLLRRICAYSGHDAEWLSQGFIGWCEGRLP